MSIALNLYYKGKNGAARKFAEESEKIGLADKIRKKQGNGCYEYFVSLNDTETVLLVECWNSNDDLHFHHNSEDMIKIAELKDKYDLSLKVERYVSECENN